MSCYASSHLCLLRIAVIHPTGCRFRINAPLPGCWVLGKLLGQPHDWESWNISYIIYYTVLYIIYYIIYYIILYYIILYIHEMNIWTRNSGILSCSTGATPIVIAYISISIQMQLAFSWFQTRSGWRCWISPLSFRPKWDVVSSLLDCRALQSGHVGFSKKEAGFTHFNWGFIKFWYNWQ